MILQNHLLYVSLPCSQMILLYILKINLQIIFNYICQTELKNINKWIIYNRLSLNLNKTCFMSINSRTIININLNNRNIEIVTVYKLLGVIIDDILNCKQHILFLKSKLKNIIRITNIISKLINKKALFHIYTSIFLPYKVL